MTDTAEPLPALSHREVRAAFFGLCVALLLAALDGTIVATALPTIVGELGGLSHLSWVVTAYLLAQTVVGPLYGKLGDIYGRRRILQVAILVFLAGSALCGLSRTLGQLIAFRALQGLGGGGLMVTAQAVVGDLVPPRERGRWQGLFGAVFGLSSIAGPLLGGFFTTHLSWRWIFYVNLPLGFAALMILRATLPGGRRRVAHRIDYAGAALLALALSAIVLVSDLGGVTWGWASAPMLGLMALAVAALVAFVLVERRASEPVLPLRLFAHRAFAIGCAVGLVVGFALFGSVTYVPLFLQVVKGSSPTASGMQMVPMMGGMLVSSIASGQIISRTGRYKVFPIAGTAIMTLGLFFLSRLREDTGVAATTGMLLMLGLGLGLVMQVLVIAVQNAVSWDDLGVATSSATLFRLVGGSLGTSVMGAIFASRLGAELAAVIPAGAEVASLTPHGVAQLAGPVRDAYRHAFTTSLDTVFLVASVVAVTGFVLAWLMPETPLRRTIAAATEGDIGGDVAETFGAPSDDDPMPELLRGLSVLADRDKRRRHMAEIVNRAGLEMDALDAFLLLRMGEEHGHDPEAIGRRHVIEADRVAAAESRLEAQGFLAGHQLTASGRDVVRKLADARRARLEELLSDWPPEQREAVGRSLARLARQLVPDA